MEGREPEMGRSNPPTMRAHNRRLQKNRKMQLKDDSSFRTHQDADDDPCGVTTREDEEQVKWETQLKDDRNFRTNVETDDECDTATDDDDEATEEPQVRGWSYLGMCWAVVTNLVMIFTAVVHFAVRVATNVVSFFAALVRFVVHAMIMLVLVSAALFLVVAFIRPIEPNMNPKSDLKTFVVAQELAVSNDTGPNSIEDIKTDTFESYAATYCMEGSTLKRARKALEVGLQDVPTSVREDIVTRALQEGITAQNNWMNTKADLVNHAKAHFYMAFYSTAFEESALNGKDVYKTCVSLSGISFTVAEIVVDYEVIEEPIAVGKKLECAPGILWSNCYPVSVYDTRTTRKPIFKRGELSLKEQNELRNWMVSQGVESAKTLVGLWNSDLSTSEGLPSSTRSWDWEPPRYAAAEL